MVRELKKNKRSSKGGGVAVEGGKTLKANQDCGGGRVGAGNPSREDCGRGSVGA